MDNATLIHGMPWEMYAKPEWLGSSALDAFPGMSVEAWSKEYLEKGYSKSATTSMGLGTALDARVTDPAEFEKKVAIRPVGLDGRTKEGKAWIVENALKSIITEAEFEEVKAGERFAKEAIKILSHGGKVVRYQSSMRGNIEGLAVQTRPDIYIEDDAETVHMVDLKYVNSKNFDNFDREFFRGRYRIQAGLFSALHFLAVPSVRVRISFLIVESGTLDPRCQVREIPAGAISSAEEFVRKRCREIKEKKEEGLVERVQFAMLEVPAWAENL